MLHSGQTGIVFNSGEFRLHGTLFLAQGDAPKPTVLLLHGIPGIEKNYDIALALRDAGWNSVIFHYRGCWGSEGDYVISTLPDDVRAALDYVSAGHHPQIDAARLVLIGHSLGGWAAVLAAASDARVHAVAVYSAVCDSRPLLNMDAKMAAEDFTPWLQGMTPDGFEREWHALDADLVPVEQVQHIAPRPLLIIHAEQDDVIPVSQAQTLYECAGEPKRLIVHAEANHSFTWHRGWLREQLLEWLKMCI